MVFYTTFYYKVCKMKQKLSISIDKEKVELLENLLKKEEFRSKSHIIEYVLNKFLQNQNDK